MDEEIVRHNLYFDKDTFAYIEQYKCSHHLRRFSSALMSIISEYRLLSESQKELINNVRENNTNLKIILNHMGVDEDEKAKELSPR